jgi:hypothetical protein
MKIRFLKKNKLLISILLFSSFLAWLFTGESREEAKNRPIKKKISSSEWCFLGIRKVWTTTDRTDELFNKIGNLIEQTSYSGGICQERIVYSYTSFDSLKQTIWFEGKPLIPYKFENVVYDSLKRISQTYEFEIRNTDGKTDTILNEKKTRFYDINNHNYKTVFEQFKENYLPPDYIKPYLKSSGGEILTRKFDYRGHVIADTSRTIFDKDIGSKDELSITNYTYDKNGFLKTKFSKDSIYYYRNNSGKVIEEKEQYSEFISSDNKYEYDKAGNLIISWLNINDGLTYKYQYDKNNRLIKEFMPGNFLLIFFPVVTYKYEYY